MARLHLGTSGFSYLHWKGIFYPPTLPAAQWLTHYAQVFSTVELNNTFYRLPRPEAVDRWKEESPRGFLFACKGSRYLTHMKRLTDEGPGIERFFDLVRRLGRKLGPVLWQLPPQMNRPDPERLDRFLRRLPRGIGRVVEFRHPAWYLDEVCDVLEAHGAAFCEHDLVDAAPPRLTGGFRYLRFHGATGKYAGRYGAAGLRAHARRLKRSLAEGTDCYVYFNNDRFGHALADALVLSDLMGMPASTSAEVSAKLARAPA